MGGNVREAWVILFYLEKICQAILKNHDKAKTERQKVRDAERARQAGIEHRAREKRLSAGKNGDSSNRNDGKLGKDGAMAVDF